MNLSKINIKNFRCFENISIDFHSQMNVFVGVNGSGKTALLDAISFSIVELLDYWNIFPYYEPIKKDARIVCIEMGSTIDRMPQIPVELEFVGMIFKEKCCWNRKWEILDGLWSSNTKREFGPSMFDIYKNADINHELPLIAYYNVERMSSVSGAEEKTFIEVENRIDGYKNCLTAGSSGNRMLDWFRKMTLQSLQDEVEIPELIAVTNALKKCAEGVMQTVKNIDVRYGAKSACLEILYTDETGIRQRQPFSELSDGYRKTLSLVADIAYRMAVLNPQFLHKVIEETNGIVLIDEIDLHLHPSWQKRILQDLREIFPKIQFIVTTHAPGVISSVREEELFILKDGEYQKAGFEVYGRDVNTVLNTVMGVAERPDDIKAEFEKFNNLLDTQKFDKAKEVLDGLRELLGNDDPEITAASVSLSLEMM